MTDVVERIRRFNHGRDPHMLALKYRAMSADPFGFLRGTCHLFYEDWPQHSPLNDAPSAWICGDLHLENVGSYKGNNRVAYFDINDFDEGLRAPCTWDVARCATSIIVAARTIGVDKETAHDLCRSFVATYARTLAVGHPRTVERETATGIVRLLLTDLRKRRRADFLNSRAPLNGKERVLKLTDPTHQNLTSADKERVVAAIGRWATTQPDPLFYRVVDVARRIAGLGSLGVDRYMLLVAGKGAPDTNYILDLKEQRGSALHPYVSLKQPAWTSEAERVVTIQSRAQGTPPALLAALDLDGRSFSLRELQPSADHIALATLVRKPLVLRRLIETLGEIVAWDHLRGSGRQKAATAETLHAFGQAHGWQIDLTDYALRYAKQVRADHKTFAAAYPPEPKGRTV